MRAPRRLLPAALAAWLLVVTGCSAPEDDPAPTSPAYEAVPDDELYDQVRSLPGVESVDAGYDDVWPENRYVVEVRLEPDADADDVADRTYAILWQGRRGAGVALQVVQDNAVVDTKDVLRFGRWIDLEERYGPQPGDGTPPAD